MSWLRRNNVGLLWFIFWILVAPFISNALSTMSNVYSNLVFYAGLTIIVLWKDRSILLKRSWVSLKRGKIWIAIILTILGLALAYGLSLWVISLFPHVSVGWAHLEVHSVMGLIAFGFSTIILPPFAEELYFRKSLIVLDKSKLVLVLTTLVSVFLFGLEHSLSPLGFVEGALLGIAFAVPYILTRNIIVTVIAHFITNFLMNGYSVFIGLFTLSKLH